MADLVEGQDEEARMRARMEEGLQEAYLDEREIEVSAADDGKLFFAGRELQFHASNPRFHRHHSNQAINK